MTPKGFRSLARRYAITNKDLAKCSGLPNSHCVAAAVRNGNFSDLRLRLHELINRSRAYDRRSGLRNEASEKLKDSRNRSAIELICKYLDARDQSDLADIIWCATPESLSRLLATIAAIRLQEGDDSTWDLISASDLSDKDLQDELFYRDEDITLDVKRPDVVTDKIIGI